MNRGGKLKQSLQVFISILVSITSAYCNFGGYTRGTHEGIGSFLNKLEENSIALEKEIIDFNLSQSVSFSGKFTFRNTSNSRRNVCFGFPQETFWDVPYNYDEHGYTPSELQIEDPTIWLDGAIVEHVDMLFTLRDIALSDSISLLDAMQIAPLLTDWASNNESGNPPSAPVMVWLVFETFFEPFQAKNVEISFEVPWYYEDEEWSGGTRTDGSREFKYITSTAGTWKDGVVSDFEANVRFDETIGDNLQFHQEDWNFIQPGLGQIKRLNYAPIGNEVIEFTWRSELEVFIDYARHKNKYGNKQYDCWNNLNYDKYL